MKLPWIALPGIAAIIALAGCAKNAGECNPACTGPLVCCDGFCVNLMTDTANCGSCGQVCEQGPCRSGSCIDLCGDVECASGQECCSETCTDTDTDQMNCGSCGATCDPGDACVEGLCTRLDCVPDCTTAETCCPVPGGDPVCANLSIDHDNCGSCGRVCPEEQSCSTGSCTSEPCDPPDCGGDPMRCCGGDCVDTDTSFEDCGYCGHACDPLAADECFGGVCTCNGAGDCSPTQKCCPDLGCRNVMTDLNNCGDCGIACESGMSCTEGVCNCGGATCPEGYGCCSGECRDLMFDSTNCGTCGHRCGMNGPACVDGSCMCGDDPPCTSCTFMTCASLVPPGPYTSCQQCCPLRGGCLPQSDADCGGCGTSCTTGTQCEPVIGPWVCTFSCLPTYTDASTDGDV